MLPIRSRQFLGKYEDFFREIDKNFIKKSLIMSFGINFYMKLLLKFAKNSISVTRGSETRFRFYMVLNHLKKFGSDSDGSDKMTSEPSVPRFRLKPTQL